MATAYAALISLMNILHDIQQHPSPPISIHAQHLHSLSQILTSLLEYLAAFQSEDDPMVMRIVDAAYKAEDVIEFHLLDTINRLPTAHQTQNSSVVAKKSRFVNRYRSSRNEQKRNLKFYQDLQRVIKEMVLIKQMAAEMVARNMVVAVRAHEDVSASAAPVRSSLSSSSMVCSDAILNGLVDMLTNDRRDRQIIPIVGMGGSASSLLYRRIGGDT